MGCSVEPDILFITEWQWVGMSPIFGACLMTLLTNTIAFKKFGPEYLRVDMSHEYGRSESHASNIRVFVAGVSVVSVHFPQLRRVR